MECSGKPVGRLFLCGICLCLAAVLEDVARLTVECLANGCQCGEPDSTDLAGFDFGEIDVGDADTLRQLIEGHFTVRHHTVKPQYDFSHTPPSLQSLVGLALELCTKIENVADKQNGCRNEDGFNAQVQHNFNAAGVSNFKQGEYCKWNHRKGELAHTLYNFLREGRGAGLEIVRKTLCKGKCENQQDKSNCTHKAVKNNRQEDIIGSDVIEYSADIEMGFAVFGSGFLNVEIHLTQEAEVLCETYLNVVGDIAEVVEAAFGIKRNLCGNLTVRLYDVIRHGDKSNAADQQADNADDEDDVADSKKNAGYLTDGVDVLDCRFFHNNTPLQKIKFEEKLFALLRWFYYST